MRRITAAAVVAVALAGLAGAEVIASCGPLAGHSYFYLHELAKKSGWTEGSVNATNVFVRSGGKLDLIIKSKDLSGKT